MDGQLPWDSPNPALNWLPNCWAALHEVVMNDPDNRLSAEVCIMGAGPVGGSLACFLASAGVSTVVIDRFFPSAKGVLPPLGVCPWPICA